MDAVSDDRMTTEPRRLFPLKLNDSEPANFAEDKTGWPTSLGSYFAQDCAK